VPRPYRVGSNAAKGHRPSDAIVASHRRFSDHPKYHITYYHSSACHQAAEPLATAGMTRRLLPVWNTRRHRDGSVARCRYLTQVPRRLSVSISIDREYSGGDKMGTEITSMVLVFGGGSCQCCLSSSAVYKSPTLTQDQRIQCPLYPITPAELAPSVMKAETGHKIYLGINIRHKSIMIRRIDKG